MLGSIEPPFDLSVYDPVDTQLFREDRLSLLALQAAFRRWKRPYTYLEIGSHLGGSLQPFLADPECALVISIDPRPPTQPDERGVDFSYPGNSTERMLEALRPTYAASLGKLRTYDSDAAGVTAIPSPPDICFIDGEHTDAAVRSDVASCFRLGATTGVLAFDDLHVVFRGYAAVLADLRRRRVAHRAYVLPRKIGVIELGPIDLWRDAAIQERLASPEAFLFVGETLAHYRDGILALKRVPGAGLARRILTMLPGGRGLRPRSGLPSDVQRPDRARSRER